MATPTQKYTDTWASLVPWLNLTTFCVSKDLVSPPSSEYTPLLYSLISIFFGTRTPEETWHWSTINLPTDYAHLWLNLTTFVVSKDLVSPPSSEYTPLLYSLISIFFWYTDSWGNVTLVDYISAHYAHLWLNLTTFGVSKDMVSPPSSEYTPHLYSLISRVRTRAVVPVCKSRMSWRRNGGMPDPRSAFHRASLSTESNDDFISIYATWSCLLKCRCNSLRTVSKLLWHWHP